MGFRATDEVGKHLLAKVRKTEVLLGLTIEVRGRNLPHPKLTKALESLAKVMKRDPHGHLAA